MSQFVKILGLLSLSAAAATGTSLWASNVNAAEEANAATVNNDAAHNDAANSEENTAESSDNIIIVPGGYGGWYGPGWGAFRPFYPGFRPFYPGFGPVYPGFRPFYPNFYPRPYFVPGYNCGWGGCF